MDDAKFFYPKNEIFKIQKKNPFLGFFTQNVHFRMHLNRFFGFFEKSAKKVIFLENALIFKKKFFDLLRQKKNFFFQNFFEDLDFGHFFRKKNVHF